MLHEIELARENEELYIIKCHVTILFSAFDVIMGKVFELWKRSLPGENAKFSVITQLSRLGKQQPSFRQSEPARFSCIEIAKLRKKNKIYV